MKDDEYGSEMRDKMNKIMGDPAKAKTPLKKVRMWWYHTQDARIEFVAIILAFSLCVGVWYVIAEILKVCRHG